MNIALSLPFMFKLKMRWPDGWEEDDLDRGIKERERRRERDWVRVNEWSLCVMCMNSLPKGESVSVNCK